MKRTICIIGGGPAGLSCALWAKQVGLSPVIVEKEAQIGCFRLGYAPNVPAIQHLLHANGIGQLALTPSGHIQTDEFCRTSLACIYAAGDVANPRDPCVATAVAHGAIAARSLDEDLSARLW